MRTSALAGLAVTGGACWALIFTAYFLIRDTRGPSRSSEAPCSEMAGPPEQSSLGLQDGPEVDHVSMTDTAAGAETRVSQSALPIPSLTTITVPTVSPYERNQQKIESTLKRLTASYKVARLSRTAPDPEYMQVDAWAKADPVFLRCVEERSNVWLCMPLDATEKQVDTFKALIRPVILERNERLQKLQESTSTTDDPGWAAGWWDIRHWERDRYMEAFMSVWPDCNASDPMPSVLKRRP